MGGLTMDTFCEERMNRELSELEDMDLITSASNQLYTTQSEDES